MENSRLETKFPRTRTVTLVIRKYVIEEVFRKQLTPEQFGPGLVSTSCISLEVTSAVLAEKLTVVAAIIRTATGFVFRMSLLLTIVVYIVSKMKKAALFPCLI